MIRAFEEGLQERGYVEGRNLDIEHRFAEGRADRDRVGILHKHGVPTKMG